MVQSSSWCCPYCGVLSGILPELAKSDGEGGGAAAKPSIYAEEISKMYIRASTDEVQGEAETGGGGGKMLLMVMVGGEENLVMIVPTHTSCTHCPCHASYYYHTGTGSTHPRSYRSKGCRESHSLSRSCICPSSSGTPSRPSPPSTTPTSTTAAATTAAGGRGGR